MAASEVRLLTATLSGTSNTPADVGVTHDGMNSFGGMQTISSSLKHAELIRPSMQDVPPGCSTTCWLGTLRRLCLVPKHSLGGDRSSDHSYRHRTTSKLSKSRSDRTPQLRTACFSFKLQWHLSSYLLRPTLLGKRLHMVVAPC